MHSVFSPSHVDGSVHLFSMPLTFPASEAMHCPLITILGPAFPIKWDNARLTCSPGFPHIHSRFLFPVSFFLSSGLPSLFLRPAEGCLWMNFHLSHSLRGLFLRSSLVIQGSAPTSPPRSDSPSPDASTVSGLSQHSPTAPSSPFVKLLLLQPHVGFLAA